MKVLQTYQKFQLIPWFLAVVLIFSALTIADFADELEVQQLVADQVEQVDSSKIITDGHKSLILHTYYQAFDQYPLFGKKKYESNIVLRHQILTSIGFKRLVKLSFTFQTAHLRYQNKTIPQDAAEEISPYDAG